jgi:magnesium transporter
VNEREKDAVIQRIITALNEVQILRAAMESVRPAETARAIQILKAVIANAHPAEIAQAIRYLDPEDQEQVVGLLSPEESGEVLLALRNVDEGAGIELAEELDSDELSEMLNVMEPDDAADVVADLREEDAAEVLELMEDEESREVQELLRHPEEAAGGVMTSEFTALRGRMTADEALQYLREHPPGRQIFYIYVTGEENELLGTVSIDRLITEGPHRKLGDMAVPSFISVTPDTDREEAAMLMTQYNIVALPVVDERKRLLGVITIDDAMDVLQDEATEDIYKLAGTSDDELLSRSAFKVAQIRLPWLFICLAGSLFSGFVIHLFSGTISQAIAIASFIPAIMAMGGNTGLQSSTATVRGIATGYISLSRVAGVIFKEIRTALLMGISCGVVMACAAFLWKGGQTILGLVVGLSIFLAVSLSATMGVLIPIIFKRMNVDPAVASGPLITMINDITGLLVYLTLATLLISRLT